MLEILLLLGLIGAASACSEEKDDSDSKKTTPSGGLGDQEFKVDMSLYNHWKPPEKRSKTFEYFDSGYDAKREIWWTRKDTWKIDL